MEVVLRSLIVAFFAFVCVCGIPYGPECNSLDEMIRAASSMSVVPGANLQCSKSRQCNGLTCALTYDEQTTMFTLDIHHCEDPPSMYLQIYTSDGSFDFERTITHSGTFELPDAPGLASLVPGAMHVYIKVDFESVSNYENIPDNNGVIIGVKIQVGMSEDLIMLDQPLLDDHFVPTPPCTSGPSLDPRLKEVQCRQMSEVIQGLPNQYDFDCFKSADCMGIDCTGTIESIPVSTHIEIDNCDEPVSLTAYLSSETLDVNWTHTFTHSGVAQIDGIDYEVMGFPVLIQIEVDMQPPKDGYMLTSITYQGCADSGFGVVCPDYLKIKMMNNTLLPIPPCHPPEHVTIPPPPTDGERPHFSTPPTPAVHSECQALDDMIRQLSRQSEDGHMMSCRRNDNCTGFNCSAVYMGDDFQMYFGIHHCQHPVEIVVALSSHTKDIHWQQTFTDGKTVPIDGLTEEVMPFGNIQVYLKMDIAKDGYDIIVSLTLKFGLKTAGTISYLPGIDFPLVENERIPVPTCDGSTRPPPPAHQGTGKPGGKPGKPGGKPDNRKVQTTVPTGNDPSGQHDAGKASSSEHTVPIAVGVVVSLVALGAIIVVFFVLRRYQCMKAGDATIIMDNKTQSSTII
ncbi:uncharacterized protein LOC144447509 [Glandiceps talaboti]